MRKHKRAAWPVDVETLELRESISEACREMLDGYKTTDFPKIELGIVEDSQWVCILPDGSVHAEERIIL